MGEKDGDALLLMGKIALALEDPVRSAGLYEQYIAEIGETPEAYNGIALAEIAQEDYDAALAAIQKAWLWRRSRESRSCILMRLWPMSRKGILPQRGLKRKLMWKNTRRTRRDRRRRNSSLR